MSTITNLLQNRLKNILISVDPAITVYEAIRTMGENAVGSVLVMQEGMLLGILTERDYARKIVLKGKRSVDTMVHEIMTPVQQLICITEKTTIEEAMELMSNNKIRHLPVLRNGSPFTVISISDLLNFIIFEQKFALQALHSYIQS